MRTFEWRLYEVTVEIVVNGGPRWKEKLSVVAVTGEAAEVLARVQYGETLKLAEILDAKILTDNVIGLQHVDAVQGDTRK